MKPETRIGLVIFIKVVTYIISIAIWAVAGLLVGHLVNTFFYGDTSFLVVIGILLGAFFAFLIDFFVYTTFIRIDEILVNLNHKDSFAREIARELNQNLQDIKSLLEKINANISADKKGNAPRSGLYV